MADLSATLSGLSSGALSFFVWLVLGLLVAGIIGLIVLLIMRRLRYGQYVIEIFQKDAFGNDILKLDKGGVFVDRKTQNKRLFIKKANIGLECNSIPYRQFGKKKVITLIKLGEKNYRVIKPKITTTGLSYVVGEEDLNWAINSYDRFKKRFDMSFLSLYMPYIMVGFGTICLLFMAIYVATKFKDITTATSNLNLASQHLEVVTENLKQIQAGTVILD